MSVAPASTTPRPTPAAASWHWALLAAILVLALLLRLHESHRGSLQQDELWSMELATGRGSVHIHLPAGAAFPAIPPMTTLAGAPGVLAIPASLRAYTHPPLYYMLLGAWRHVLDGPISARNFSAVLSVLAIGIFTDAARRLFGPAPALLTAALLTLSRPSVQVDVEVRPYALALFLTACAFHAWTALAQSRRPALSAYALAVLVQAAELTHYFTLAVFLALGIASLTLLRGDVRRYAAKAILGGTCMFFLVWGRSLHAQHAAGYFSPMDEANAFLIRADSSLGPLMQSMLLLPARLIHVPSGDHASPAYWVNYLGALLWLLPFTIRRLHPLAPIAGFLAVGGALAPAALDALRGTEHLAYLRYPSLALPGLALALALIPACAADRRMRRWLTLVPLAACALAAASLPASYGDKREDLTVIARTIDAAVPPKAPLLFAGEPDVALRYIPRAYLLIYDYYGQHRPHPFAITHGPLPPADIAQLSAGATDATIWTVSEPQSPGPAVALSGYTPLARAGRSIPEVIKVIPMVPATPATRADR